MVRARVMRMSSSVRGWHVRLRRVRSWLGELCGWYEMMTIGYGVSCFRSMHV